MEYCPFSKITAEIVINEHSLLVLYHMIHNLKNKGINSEDVEQITKLKLIIDENKKKIHESYEELETLLLDDLKF